MAHRVKQNKQTTRENIMRYSIEMIEQNTQYRGFQPHIHENNVAIMIKNKLEAHQKHYRNIFLPHSPQSPLRSSLSFQGLEKADFSPLLFSESLPEVALSCLPSSHFISWTPLKLWCWIVTRACHTLKDRGICQEMI